MIHSLHNARFTSSEDVPSQCIAGYVFSMPGGDDYIQTQPIQAIWEDDGELYIEDKAVSTYQIADFYDDDAASQVGSMREEIFRGFFWLDGLTRMPGFLALALCNVEDRVPLIPRCAEHGMPKTTGKVRSNRWILSPFSLGRCSVVQTTTNAPCSY